MAAWSKRVWQNYQNRTRKHKVSDYTSNGVKDENFPFEDNEAVRVRIEDGKLVVEKIE